MQLRDHRLLRLLVGQALPQALALELADLDVVEADVVLRAAAERQPVVVDGRDAWFFALSSTALPVPESRLTIMRTVAPLVIC